MSTYTPKNTAYENIFIARQPIFDRINDLWGFELLYRASAEAENADITDPDFSTMLVSTCGYMQQAGISNSSTRTTINFTENLILDRAPKGLPPSSTVVEVPVEIMQVEEVKEAILELKESGYMIAVAFNPESSAKELMNLADIIKIDVLSLGRSDIVQLLRKITNKNALKLAERIDNHDMHGICHGLGFDLFQGYYYAKPHQIKGKKISANLLSNIKLLDKLQQEGVDIDDVVAALKLEPSIGYKLLRYINSPAFGLSAEIDTIKRASDMLGFDRLARWLKMVLFSDIKPQEKTTELYRRSLERARFFEEVSRSELLDIHPDACFTFGLLSLMDVLLDMSIEDVLQQLPLSDTLTDGYVNEQSPLNGYLDLVKLLEQNEIERMKDKCAISTSSPDDIICIYSRSVAWADNAFLVMQE